MNRHTLIKGLLVLFAAAVPRTANAQPAPTTQPMDTLRFEYAVKAVCGRSVLTNPAPPLAYTGLYFTSINIHNPGGKTVPFRYKVAATAANEAAVLPTPFTWRELRPDHALRIDCNRIGQLAPGSPSDVFVIIQSPRDLDVVAVYSATAGAPQSGTVSTMDIERVPLRRVLILPGAANPVDIGAVEAAPSP